MLGALEERGVEARTVVWSDPGVDWAAFDLVVANGTWDNIHRVAEFLAWVDTLAAAGVRLANAPAILRWNLDKRYLRDLEAAGVPTVPTSWVGPDGAADGFGPSAAVLPPVEIVVKPSVSGGGYRTARYEAHEHDAAQAHIGELVAAGHTAMVQPYQAAVDTEGEVGLVFLGGAFSHAIHKDPMIRRGVGASDSLIANQVVTCATPTDGQLAVALSGRGRGRATARPHHVRRGSTWSGPPTASPPCSSSSSSTPCSSSSRVPSERRASPPSCAAW